jgi:hypothetical protein
MSAYAYVLFVHVVSAIGMFVALVLEGFVLARIRSAEGLTQVRLSTRAFTRLRAIYIPSGTGILAGGMYLASKYGRGTFWIPAALLATLLILVVGGAVTGRKMAGLQKKLSGGAPASYTEISSLARSKFLMFSYGLRAGLALGIVFLMTAKPAAVPSAVALVAGSMFGLGVAEAIQRNSGEAGNRSERGSSSAQPTAAARS